MKIAEGSTCEIEVIYRPNKAKIFIYQDDDAVMISIDDIPELINVLDKISRGESES
jgi:hypothetical protein